MPLELDYCTLALECTPDALSPAQLAAYEKIENECKAIKDKLQDWKLITKGEKIYTGEFFSAHQFDGYLEDISQLRTQQMPLKPPPKQVYRNTPPPPSSKRRAAPISFAEFDDDDEVPLAKRMAKSRSIPTPPPSKSKGGSIKQMPPAKGRSGHSPQPTPIKFRPTEATSQGGLTVGTDTKKENTKDTSGKLQGKTFPSLVVLAKPSLKPKETGNTTRSKLDSKVKVVLMLTPSKFTEWLIQEGLLKSVQRCSKHKKNVLKLGVYSEASKFPYSGGYVWISECCPTNFISVFHGSIFENAPHPPSCILKLIYHWSCQTNIQNVVQWVKVDNVYIKGVYTWLRAICTLAVNQKMKQLGGTNKYVEVGVISLGTTSQNGQQRQVKVEVLGVLDYAEKTIRLRAIEPTADSDKNYKKRFIAILDPLQRWADRNSTLCIDLTIDKTILQSMGFKHIIQAAAHDPTAKHTNAGVMDYLRKVVPRMFQNTLSLLSRQMIQQFLDELVWREQWGSYPLQAFNTITTHIAEQTKLEGGDNLTQRLYQVATNPFKDWSVSECREPSKVVKIDLSAVETYNANTYRDDRSSASKSSQQRGSSSSSSKKPVSKETPWSAKSSASSSKAKQPIYKEEPKLPTNMKGLEEVYYGRIWPVEEDTEDLSDNQAFKCEICSESFPSNIALQKDILSHFNTDKSYLHQCVFCLEKHTTDDILNKHIQHQHPLKSKNSSSLSYHCLICQNRFNSVTLLAVHVQKNHVPLELPYKCGACQYRTSNHGDVINHFYSMHNNQNVLQCPFCLDVFWIFTNGIYLDENVKTYYLHLKQHFNRAQKKECGKCILTFISKGALKYHSINDHQSFFKVGNKVKKLVYENVTQIQAPKTKPPPSRTTIPYVVDKQFQAPVKVMVEKGKPCIECDYEITEENHHKGLLKCQKCQYRTCCTRAMVNHSTCCVAGIISESSARIDLDNEMHCVCGFSSSDGNSLARHLATCGHKSAYISHQSAQENIVKKSMFEMLGLVRVEDEAGIGAGAENEAVVEAGAENDGKNVEGNDQNDIIQMETGDISQDDGGDYGGETGTDNIDDIIEQDDGISESENNNTTSQMESSDVHQSIDELVDTEFNQTAPADSTYGQDVQMDASDFMDSMMSGVSTQAIDESGIIQDSETVMGTADMPSLQTDY